MNPLICPLCTTTDTTAHPPYLKNRALKLKKKVCILQHGLRGHSRSTGAEILRARNKSTILRYTAGRAMANVITRRPPAFTAVFRHISQPLTQVTQY